MVKITSCFKGLFVVGLFLLAPLASVSAVNADGVAGALARAAADDRVGRGVVNDLRRSPSVRVMVAFSLAGSAEISRMTAAVRNREVASARGRILSRLSAADFEVLRQFQSVNAVAGNISASGVGLLLDDPNVLRIDLDEGGSGNLLQALPLMDIDTVKSSGWTGAGVTVAVLDSGYDTDHVDLSDDLVDETCRCSGGLGCCPGGGATQSGAGSAEDDHGHGTNVTGIITSKGAMTPAGGAPDADIVAVKVLDSNNAFCCSSDVVAGLDYIINNRPDVDIVNMSLGTNTMFSGTCDSTYSWTIAFATAIDTLRNNGVLTFVSAGNNGSGTQMSAPACIANSVAVGAVWDSNEGPAFFSACTESSTAADQVACFSNSNSTTDLFAAGAWTRSAGMGGGSSTYAGTSQASPASAACAANLMQAAPAATPAEVEAALEASPVSVTDATNGLSFPRVDCDHALSVVLAGQTTTTTTTSTTTTTTLPDFALEHYLCYKGAAKWSGTVTLTDKLDGPAPFEVKKSAGLCTPANKNGEGVLDADTHLQAFKLKGLHL
ncbi:MAG: S8 family serine peptidase, partial [bacterium]